MKASLTSLLSPLALALASCTQPAAGDSAANAGLPFTVTAHGTFEEPWALAFLPGTAFALISERPGRLLLWEDGKPPLTVAGVPAVAYSGQGGLGDVRPAPDFATSGMVYLSWAENGLRSTRGAVVGRTPRSPAMATIHTASPSLPTANSCSSAQAIGRSSRPRRTLAAISVR
jgi:glucose/arabinose dehydrogenase